MNEERKDMLELLKVMKDLNGQGFRLNSEINATVHAIIHDLNIDKYANVVKFNGVNIKGSVDNKLIASLETELKKKGFVK